MGRSAQNDKGPSQGRSGAMALHGEPGPQPCGEVATAARAASAVVDGSQSIEGGEVVSIGVEH
jgi:hypothetical protein